MWFYKGIFLGTLGTLGTLSENLALGAPKVPKLSAQSARVIPPNVVILCFDCNLG